MVFTLLLLFVELLIGPGMSMGEEGELEREGIAGVLLERSMAGLMGTRLGVGGVVDRICTGSLSSSLNAIGSWSQSILYIIVFLLQVV